MATREKLKAKKVDLEQDFDFDNFGFEDMESLADPDVKKDNRSAVTKVFKGTISGAKSAIKDPSFYGKAVKSALPEEYGEILKTTDQVTSEVSSLYHDAVKELKPTIGRAVREIDKLVPKQMSKTKGFIEKLNKILDDRQPSTQSQTKETLQDQNINNVLGSIFKEQAEADSQARAEDQTQAFVRDKVEAQRFKDSFGALSTINMNIERLTRYNDQVNAAYQRKSLELQLRSYYTQMDLLENNKRYFEIFKIQQEAIAKNTGLPEFVKIKESERFTEMARTKLFDKIQSGLFGDGEFLKRGFGRIRTAAKDKISSIKDAFDEGIMGLEQVSAQNELASILGEDSVTASASMAGNLGMEALAKKLGKKIGSRLFKKDSKVAKAGLIGSMYSKNLPGALKALKDHMENKALEDPGVFGYKNALKDILSFFVEGKKDLSLETGSDINNLTGPAIFDQSTRKSIVTVIPGYLARIYREIQVLRTGNENTDLTLFDHSKDSFTEKTSLVKGLKKSLAGNLRKDDIEQSVQDVFQHVVGDKKLSKGAQQALLKVLRESAFTTNMQRGSDLSSIVAKSIKPDRIRKELSNHLSNSFDLGIDEQLERDPEKLKREAIMVNKMMDLRSRVKDPREFIQPLLSAGYSSDDLMDLGILTRDEEGKLSVNYDKYRDFIMKKKQEDQGIATSDVNAKENITAIDPKKALKAVSRIPIFKWLYKKGRGDTKRHVGPMAQDTHRSLGPNAAPGGKSIDLVTLNGINMAAITALHEQQEKLESSLKEGGSSSSLLPLIVANKENTDRLINKLDEIKESSGSGFNLGLSKDLVDKFKINPEVFSNTKEKATGYIDLIRELSKTSFELLTKTTRDVSSFIVTGGQKAGKNIKDKVYQPSKDFFESLYKNKKDDFIKNVKGIYESGSKLVSNVFNSITDRTQDFITNKLPVGYGAVVKGIIFGKDKLLNFIDRPVDVYAKGKTSPVLRAVIMKAGGYRDQITGKVITRLSEIKGPVVDHEGNVVLTVEDIEQGIVDSDGHPIKAPLQKLLEMGIALPKVALGRIASVGRRLKEAIPRFKGFSSSGSSGDKQTNVLLDIRDILNSRLPGKKKLFNDKDGDGERDGGWKSMLGKLKNRKKKDQGDKPENEMRYRSGKNIFDAMAEKAAGVYDSVKNGLSDLGDLVGDLKSGGRRGGRSRAGKIASRAGGFFKRTGSSVLRGAAGLASYLPSGVMSAGGSVLRGAATVGRVGLSAAGLMASTAGSAVAGALGAGATAIGSVLASPVVLGAAATALAGYGLYKGYKYFTRNKASELTEIRMRQYGLTADQKDHYHYIFELESYLEEEAVGYQGNEARLLPNKLNGEKLFDIFGIEPEDQEAVMRFMQWFNDRFKPIFLTHITALTFIDNKRKLHDADDLDDKLKLRYINASAYPKGPYYVTTSPFSDIRELPATEDDVKKAIEVAKSKLKVKDDLKTEGVTGAASVVAGKAISDKLDGQTTEGKSSESNSSFLSRMTKFALSPVGFLASKIAEKVGGGIKKLFISATEKIGRYLGYKLTALEAVRFKSYGLVGTNANRVSALRNLEEALEGLVTYSGSGEASFNGDVSNVIKEAGGAFGVSSLNHPHAENFTKWFKLRFLPVYLMYTGYGKEHTNKTKAYEIEQALKPSKRLDIATKISSIPNLWSIHFSPWPNFSAGMDSSVITENINFLKDTAKNEEVQEEKKTKLEPGSGNLVKNAVSGKPVLTPSTKGNTPAELSQKATVSASGASLSQTSTSPRASGEQSGKYLVIGHGVDMSGLNPELVKNFKALAEEYGDKTGKKTYVTSGYRSTSKQQELYSKNPSMVAKPGTSLHNFGLAIDVSSSTLNEMSAMGLLDKYGFVRPIRNEPWHLVPKGIQENRDQATKDPKYASQIIAAAGGRVVESEGSPMGTSSGTGESTQVAFSGQSSGSNVSSIASQSSAASGSSVSTSTDQVGSVSSANSTIQTTAPQSKDDVKKMLDEVASTTGVDPSLLKVMAAVESNLDPNAKAGTSSATGLFQFTKGTWNDMVRRYGRKYGIGPSTSPSDPKANALMAAEYIKQNQSIVSGSGSSPSYVDIYMAHFLGPNGAKALAGAPNDSFAAKVLDPKVAESNKSIFYKKDGSMRTKAEVYALMESKLRKNAVAHGIDLPESVYTQTAANDDSFSTDTSSQSTTAETTNQVAQTQTSVQKVSRTQGFALPQADLVGFNAPSRTQPQVTQQQNLNLGLETGINNIDKTLVESLDVQKQMLEVMKTIMGNLDPSKLQEFSNNMMKVMNQATGSQNGMTNTPDTTNNGTGKLPQAGVSLQRKQA